MSPTVTFGSIPFEANSTEQFNSITLEIGWLQYSTCIEGNNEQTYNSNYSLDEFLYLAQYAVTIKFLPSTDIPGEPLTEQSDQYGVMADLCSNPIYALNNGYMMAFTVDETSSPPVLTGYGNTDNWIGTNAVTMMSNNCYDNDKSSGDEPSTLEDGYVTYSCGNADGLNILAYTGYNPQAYQCWLDWDTYTGLNPSIWLGFDINQELNCHFVDGEYELMTSAPTSDPTMAPSVQPTTRAPTLDPTQPPWTASCDYSYIGPYEVVKESILETVVLYDVVSLRFEVMTAVNFTCADEDGFCNFLRLGANATSSTVPKLPQLVWRSDTNILRIVIHRNNGTDAWEISNDSYTNTFNDGRYHQYELYISPTERIFIYDNVTYVNSTGDYDASDYLNGTGREWILTISMNDDLQSGDAYIRDFCIETYALTDSPTSDPTISPSVNPTHSPSVFPTTPSAEPTISPTEIPSSSPSEDPTNAPSTNPSVRPTVDPTLGPILDPTMDPTVSPSANPTIVPSGSPTSDPTSAHPTSADVRVNVSFAGVPEISTSFLPDPYGLYIAVHSLLNSEYKLLLETDRFEASIIVIIVDDDNVLGEEPSECESCFMWQYTSGERNEWSTFDYEVGGDISMSITNSGDEYKSKLVVQSIRRLYSGHCVDDDDAADHPFEEGTDYRLRLKFVSDSEEYYVSEISGESNFSTNVLPNGGECSIQNMDSLAPLDSFNLLCNGWRSAMNLTYNALIDDVVMNTGGFVQNASQITGIAPVGNITIVVLVKEYDTFHAITCYEIDASFSSITANETDAVLNSIDSLVANESFAENPDYAVSIQTVVGDLFDGGLVNQSTASSIIDDVVDNMLNSSLVSDGESIITELSTFSSVTSNEDIVDWESTTTALVDEYFPDIFDSIDLYIENASNSSSTKVPDALYSIGEQSQELISNLESTLVGAVNISNATDDELDSVNSLSESLVDYATYAASTALAHSDVGESFNYKSDTKTVVAVKFDSSRTSSSPSCGSSTQSIAFPETFTSDNSGTFDCAFMSSKTDNFIPINNQNADRSLISEGIVTANIYGSRPSGRRRLATKMEYNASACFPYLITIKATNSSFNLSMTLGESSDFPSCDFWNTNDSYWDTAGCFVYDIVNDSIICGCTHLTSFSLSASDVLPTTNIQSEIDWKDLSVNNLIKYPTVLAVVVSLFIIFGIICIINPRASKVHDASILASGDGVFKSVRDEKLWRDILGKEIKWFSSIPNHESLGKGIMAQLQTKEDRKSLCNVHWHLWITYLKNEYDSASF